MVNELLINSRWPLKLPDSPAEEWRGNMKFHGDNWELKRLLRLEEIIKTYARKSKFSNGKPIVLYVGAYKGDMAALLASWSAKLMMVEATAGFWPLIKETWEMNGLETPLACFSGLISRHTTTDQTDFSDWPTRSELFIEGTTGFAHLAESGGHFPEISIDELIKRTGIKPDIITIDVEGSELEALYGAMDTIQNLSPVFMLSVHPEFMFHNHGTYERELHDLLRNNNYQGQWLDYDHEHHWLYTKEKV